jgi:hypothetical protein
MEQPIVDPAEEALCWRSWICGTVSPRTSKLQMTESSKPDRWRNCQGRWRILWCLVARRLQAEAAVDANLVTVWRATICYSGSRKPRIFTLRGCCGGLSKVDQLQAA